MDWNGRGSEDQIHPSGQPIICSLLIKEKQLRDENRKAEVQRGTRRRHCLARKHCRIGKEEIPGRLDKRRPCPMCGAQNQLQTRRSTCSMCETPSVTVWKCSTCSDGIRKQGILCCKDCMEHAAQVKGDEAAATEKDACASGSTEGAEKLRSQVKVTENDLRRCIRCEEPFFQRRARRQDHGHEFGKWMQLVLRQHTNKSLMDLHVHGMPTSLLHRVSRQKLEKHLQRELPDRLRYHPLFHLCLRLTRVTSTCFSYSQRSTRSLSNRQSSGS